MDNLLSLDLGCPTTFSAQIIEETINNEESIHEEERVYE